MNSPMGASVTQVAGPMGAAGEGAVLPWWTDGWHAHDFKNAANYAAALLDITGNGRPSSTGVAPTHTAGVGLVFNGSTHYLITPFTPATTSVSAIIKLSAVTPGDSRSAFGMANVAGSTSAFAVQQTGGNRRLYNGTTGMYYSLTGAFAVGTYAIAGKTAYYNGSPVGTITAGAFGAAALALYIGCLNVSGATQHLAMTATSWIIYDHVRSDAQIAATSAAMP